MNWRVSIFETLHEQKAERSAAERQLSVSWLTSSWEEGYMKSCSTERERGKVDSKAAGGSG